ncbi:Protein CBR-SIR-2.4 [Caenorhabditis briggsae]|uniref:protein acetyllysine N-acetyltransferase n=1 Tax=Caenorhabditis briggsae TaxID=6238 RepID=A8WVR7_CAEBR|nr:Protein CBR-SIR-2.4 [Caenorhabditis briggsae]CAP24730.2 Protein CBR-SIR-2.4 [Caenorhabditis briggsae]
MTSVYESLLSEYPDKGVVGKPEVNPMFPTYLKNQCFQIRDTEDQMIEKLRVLTNHFRNAKDTEKPIFVLIGAGVSTGSKLPDFRGKQGVWTLQAEGKHAEGVNFQVVRHLKFRFNLQSLVRVQARPGVSHKCILALHKAGYIKTIITQNVDGLDRKVGIPVEDLIEVHGNLFLEVCQSCFSEYVRENIVMSVGLKPTGRNCEGNKKTGRSCRGKLRDATLDWDSEIDHKHLTKIKKTWKESSHLLCIGTSLEIIPMGSLPVDAKARGIKTTTINYQETAHEKIVETAIHADVKLILYSLCHSLGVEVDLGNDLPDEVPVPLEIC